MEDRGSRCRWHGDRVLGVPRAALGSSSPAGEPGVTLGIFQSHPWGPSPSKWGSAPWMLPTSTRVSPCCILHLSTAPSFSSPRAAAPLEMGIPNGIPKWDPTRAPARDGALTMRSSLKPALPLHQAKASRTTRWLREVQPEFILLLAKLLFSREPKEIAGLCPSPLFDAGFINSV